MSDIEHPSVSRANRYGYDDTPDNIKRQEELSEMEREDAVMMEDSYGLTMDDFLRASEDAEEAVWMGVRVTVPNGEKDEIIINDLDNFEAKLKYYQKAYDKNLQLRNDHVSIKFSGYAFVKSLDSLTEWIRYGESIRVEK
jgi:hypothetical protein